MILISLNWKLRGGSGQMERDIKSKKLQLQTMMCDLS
jgi:hypothetical protein